VRVNLRQALAVKPAKQTDEMFPSTLIFDSRNSFSSHRRHEARKLQIGMPGAEKLNQLILQLEESKGLFAVGNLEDIFPPSPLTEKFWSRSLGSGAVAPSIL
jgi:hypothetical protein